MRFPQSTVTVDSQGNDVYQSDSNVQHIVDIADMIRRGVLTQGGHLILGAANTNNNSNTEAEEKRRSRSINARRAFNSSGGGYSAGHDSQQLIAHKESVNSWLNSSPMMPVFEAGKR